MKVNGLCRFSEYFFVKQNTWAIHKNRRGLAGPSPLSILAWKLIFSLLSDVKYVFLSNFRLAFTSQFFMFL